MPIAPVPGSLSGLPQPGSKPPAGAAPIPVTVAQNSSETVIDLGAAFATVSGIQHADGLKLAILGNTNSALVKTDLSEASLTLTYAPGKCGTATITVAATDADGVSVKQTILVTVQPPGAAGVVSAAPLPPGIPTAMGHGTPR
jgi:hypothetical protein